MMKSMAVIQLSLLEERFGEQLFRIGKTAVRTNYQAFAMQKRAPWRDRFNMEHQRIIDSGMLFHLLKQVTTSITKSLLKTIFFPRSKLDSKYWSSQAKDVPPPTPFKTSHFMGPFGILAIGLFLSTLAWVLERAVYWRLASIQT